MNQLSEYIDPLEYIWRRAAKQFGFNVERSKDVYASNNGRGIIYIAENQYLDPEDSMAQMILHELCHGLVQGESKVYELDWGFGKEGQTEEEETAWEHAALRLQAALLQQHGLRDIFIPTTPFRSYYQNLGANPLSNLDDCAPFLQKGIALANRAPYRIILNEALNASYQMISVLQSMTYKSTATHFLWDGFELPKCHATGRMELSAWFNKKCLDCVWFNDDFCQKNTDAPQKILGTFNACSQFEQQQLDCQSCAACCCAFDQIPISDLEFVHLSRLNPKIVTSLPDYTGMTYNKSLPSCAALAHSSDRQRWHCTIYEERPLTCQDVEKYGPACLFARQKQGFTLQ